MARSLNDFYTRFDVDDFSDKHSELRDGLLSAQPLEVFFDEQSVVLSEALSILSDAAHPLYVKYNLLPSGVRLRAPCASKNRCKFSLVPGTLNAVGGRSGR